VKEARRGALPLDPGKGVAFAIRLLGASGVKGADAAVSTARSAPFTPEAPNEWFQGASPLGGVEGQRPSPCSLHFDVVIVGAGPAGCAAALALRQSAPELRIVLIEAASVPRRRAGEVLPAAGVAMLRQLGVAQAVAPAARPAPGLASCWGGPEVRERVAVFSASGPDWHLDRDRFDALLADSAASAGVTVRQGVAVTGAEALGAPGAGWRLRLATGEILTARLAIWATGRRRGFPGSVGARATAYDRLAGYVRRFAAPPDSDPRTLLEAAPDGWWYAASDPSGVRVVAFMTDADLGRRLGAATPDGWNALFEGTRLMGPVGAATHADVEVSAAHSSLVDPVCGADWVAAGDASSCFEPLASRGIASALRSGCFAAYLCRDILGGNGEQASAHYAAIIRREFAAYRQGLAAQYALERRWANRPFWARRLA
jgi:flavin-dependent dehydrogenase